MKKQTAAEKFDLVPPWCVVKKVPGHNGFGGWRIESHDGARRAFGPDDGDWSTGGHFGYIDTEAEARRIARLTRPLDSWEPDKDSPLPAEGWKVCKPATSTSLDNRWMVAGPDGKSIEARYFPTRRAAYVWAWTEATVTDDTGATDGPSDELTMVADRVRLVEGEAKALTARVSKVEGVLYRICPEADEQVDGKGRTLVQINRELDDLIAWRRDVRDELQGLDRWCDRNAERLDKLESLIAAQVPAVQPGRNDAAAHNAIATDVAAVDEAWREKLVVVSGSRRIVYDPTANWYCEPDLRWSRSCVQGSRFERRDMAKPSEMQRNTIRTCPPPPNLAEWYRPEAKATTGADSDYAVLARTHDAVPPTYRVGDDLAAWVRHLASAHDTALKDMAEYRKALEVANANFDKAQAQLADANESARQAEGRAATATARATEAESKLAEVRAQLEAALN